MYVPPTYGSTSYQRPVNAPDFTFPNAGGSVMSVGGGRGAYAGAAAQAARSAAAPDAATGLAAMDRTGIAGKLQNRFNEQRGLKQNQGGTVAPQKPTGPGTPTHGNPAAQSKRAAATQLADQMVEQELTGQLPGDTGQANVRKSRKKTANPDQQTLF